MQTINALRERRSALAKNLHDLLDENPGNKWSTELQARYDESMLEIESIKSEEKRVQQILDEIADQSMEERLLESGERQAHGKKLNTTQALYNKWLRLGDKAMTNEDWKQIRATLSTTTNTEGGYTVPTEVVKGVMDAMKWYGGMREVSTVIQTAEGMGDLNYPTSDGTSEIGELIAQNTTATSQDPTFGVQAITAYKFSSKVVAVPYELLQDSVVNIEDFINKRLGTRLGRVTNTFFTTGTGTAQPRGVVTAAASGKVGTTGQTATVIFDDLVDLVHSVDPAYRGMNNCKFMMHDNSLRTIRKIKDTQGRPIFLPGYEGLGTAMPDMVLGYPIQINQDMATMAANAKSILFGDFSYYIIRDVMGMTLFRFDDSAYVKLGQVGFLAWLRSGGNFVDVGGAVKYYANSAT